MERRKETSGQKKGQRKREGRGEKRRVRDKEKRAKNQNGTMNIKKFKRRETRRQK